MAYVISCYSRYVDQKGERDEIFLVDRRKCKTKFWTSIEKGIVLVLDTEEEAQRIASRLRFNDPEVINAEAAFLVMEDQYAERSGARQRADFTMHQCVVHGIFYDRETECPECEDEIFLADAGWDSHKMLNA